jgi:secondary thiamine-phosphate synthase enzyme
MKTFQLRTKKRCEFIDITSQVARIVGEEKLSSGLCVVFCPHTTAGLTINENADPSVRQDIINHLAKLIPEGRGYAHLEGNADSHIKASLVGSSLQVIVEGGQLVLGTWQGIYFCEFDGPRTRNVYIKIIKG